MCIQRKENKEVEANKKDDFLCFLKMCAREVLVKDIRFIKALIQGGIQKIKIKRGSIFKLALYLELAGYVDVW